MRQLLAKKDSFEKAERAVKHLQDNFEGYEFQAEHDDTRARVVLVANRPGAEGGINQADLDAMRTIAGEDPREDIEQKDTLIGSNQTTGGLGGGPV